MEEPQDFEATYSGPSSEATVPLDDRSDRSRTSSVFAGLLVAVVVVAAFAGGLILGGRGTNEAESSAAEAMDQLQGARSEADDLQATLDDAVSERNAASTEAENLRDELRIATSALEEAQSAAEAAQEEASEAFEASRSREDGLDARESELNERQASSDAGATSSGDDPATELPVAAATPRGQVELDLRLDDGDGQGFGASPNCSVFRVHVVNNSNTEVTSVTLPWYESEIREGPDIDYSKEGRVVTAEPETVQVSVPPYAEQQVEFRPCVDASLVEPEDEISFTIPDDFSWSWLQ